MIAYADTYQDILHLPLLLDRRLSVLSDGGICTGECPWDAPALLSSSDEAHQGTAD